MVVVRADVADGERALANQLAATVDGYLQEHAYHRACVTNRGPLRRRVNVRAATWLPWVSTGTRPGRRSSYKLPDANSGPAVELLEDPRLESEEVPAGDLRVDRPLLAELARSAQTTQEPSDLVQLFVATMMWGSGKSNGRGPRRTAQALSAGNLADTLRTTSDAVYRGNLVAAYERFVVQGVGEAFFTKWLWSASLGGPESGRPLILDVRVRRTLRRLLGQHPSWRTFRGSTGYASYVSMLHAAADILAERFKQVDAEKIEWLLFDRSSHQPVAELGLDAAPQPVSQPVVAPAGDRGPQALS